MVMKCKRLSNNLYAMDGDVVTTGNEQENVVREGEANQFKLWHSKLCHLHDQGHQELEKRGLIPRMKKKIDWICE